MKKIFTAAVIIQIFFSVYSSAEITKYSDVKAFIHEMTRLQNSVADALEKSATPAETAAVFNRYTMGIKKIMPVMREIEKKYPELKSNDSPAELKEDVANLEKATHRVVTIMGSKKILEHMKDQAVTDSLTKLQQAANGTEAEETKPAPDKNGEDIPVIQP